MKNIFVLLLSLFLFACAGKKEEKQNISTSEEPIEITLSVIGMTCSSCEKKIENKLIEMEAILETSANHQDSSTTILFHPDRIEISEITKLIEQNGYKVEGEIIEVEE